MTSYFSIDVGGTFTDVVARRADGRLTTYKILSSGAVRGLVESVRTDPDNARCVCVQDSRRIGDPEDFWVGYDVHLISCAGDNENSNSQVARVTGFDARTGELSIECGRDSEVHTATPAPFSMPHSGLVGVAYELRSPEEAPVLAIRYLMGLGLNDPIGVGPAVRTTDASRMSGPHSGPYGSLETAARSPVVDVRLGTTRATNALLERKGAKVAFVTTKGFGDILEIGYQDRPALFDLNIRKRDELYTTVVEIDERISAAGDVLREPDEQHVREQLERVRQDGIEALAICLLHSHVNPIHEEMVAAVAESVGFGACSDPVGWPTSSDVGETIDRGGMMSPISEEMGQCA